MRALVIIGLIFGFLHQSQGQNIGFKLTRKNSIKSFSPKKKDFLMVAVDESPSLTESSFLYVYGMPKFNGVDSLTIEPHRIYRKTKKNNGPYIKHSESDYKNKLPLMVIGKNSIQYVQYRSNFKWKVNKIAKVAFLSSLLSALLIAPLSSYDFVAKEMNMDSYKNWLIGSGIATGVSLVTLSLSKKKKYYLKPALDKNHKLWSFE